jgi:hypothetical protein
MTYVIPPDRNHFNSLQLFKFTGNCIFAFSALMPGGCFLHCIYLGVVLTFEAFSFYLRFNVYCSAFADFLGVLTTMVCVGQKVGRSHHCCEHDFFFFFCYLGVPSTCICMFTFPLHLFYPWGLSVIGCVSGLLCQQNWLPYLALTGSIDSSCPTLVFRTLSPAIQPTPFVINRITRTTYQANPNQGQSVMSVIYTPITNGGDTYPIVAMCSPVLC